MNMQLLYFDELQTYHIIQIIESDKGLQIYEYGRFNELYEHVHMKFKLYSDTNTLDDLLNYIDEYYSTYKEGEEFFITENDKYYQFNPKYKTLEIFNDNKNYSLTRCCYKNIYHTDDHELYVLHDTELNELLVLKKDDFDSSSTHLCDVIYFMHMEQSVYLTINYNRIKHFSNQLQKIGSIVISSVSPYKDELEFSIKFHEKPDFEDINERCCIYNMMQKISNSHYSREYAKMKL